MSDDADTRMYRLKIDQIIADIEQKLADAARKRQEVQLAPWAIVITIAAAITGAFAAGAAFFKLLQ